MRYRYNSFLMCFMDDTLYSYCWKDGFIGAGYSKAFNTGSRRSFNMFVISSSHWIGNI